MDIISIIYNWLANKVLNNIFDKLTGKTKKKDETIKVIELIEEKNKEFQNKDREINEKNKEIIALINALKRKGLSKERLIERYQHPLNVILISISDQKIKKNENDRYWSKPKNKEKEIRKELIKNFDAKHLGGALWIIPPSKIPENISTNKDLQNFFENKILKKHKNSICKLNVIALVDIKKMFWKNYLPYEQRKPKYYTVGEVLSIEDIFNKEKFAEALQNSGISAAQPILDGDIGFFASNVLNEEELNILHKYQSKIEKELGNPPLRILANDEFVPKISEVLSPYFKNSEQIAKEIVKEAKFWYQKLSD
jgi:hypothetical protein